jgi:uncharacterized membrane protein
MSSVRWFQLSSTVVAALLAATTIAHAIDYRFETIDYPGAGVTELWGLNDAGYIVGTYRTPSFEPGGGFVRAPDGTFTTLSYPGARFTYPFGVNNLGQIVGDILIQRPGSFDLRRPFLRDSDGTYHLLEFSYPASRYDSIGGKGLNDSGDIVGDWYSYSPYHGGYIKRTSGEFQDLPRFEEGAEDVNNSGMIAGNFVDGGSLRGLIQEPDGTFIAIPNPPNHLTGINNNGDAVGYWNEGSFVRSAQGRFTPLNVPTAEFTTAEDINDLGQIVGSYCNNCGNEGSHGFLATLLPVPEPSATWMFAFGLVTLVLWVCWRKLRDGAAFFRMSLFIQLKVGGLQVAKGFPKGSLRSQVIGAHRNLQAQAVWSSVPI